MEAQWVRFDIPYSEDANQMRLFLAYEKAGKPAFSALLCRSVPEGLELLKAHCAADSIVLGKGLTFVFPLDDRHGLAWMVREPADANEYGFSRFPPKEFPALPEWDTALEGFSTGSENEGWDIATVYNFVRDKNDEAHGYFSTGMDLPSAMRVLRECLQVIWKHEGWLTPAALYSLRNYLYVLIATGAYDNEADILAWLRRLLWHRDQVGAFPPEAAEFLPNLADLATRCGDEGLAGRLSS